MTRTTERIQIPVAGMTCQGCALAVERALGRVDGVREARVNYGSKTATVDFDPDLTGGRILGQAVHDAGYSVPESLGEARALADDVRFLEENQDRELRADARDLLVCIVFGAASIALSAGGQVGPALLAGGIGVLVGARRIHTSGIAAALRLAPDMNTLVAMGILAAFVSASLAPVFPEVFGEPAPHLRPAVMIAILVLVGRVLEGRARSRAGGAVRALLDLAPPRARVSREGVEQEVDLAEVVSGDLVLVRPGERFPVDGKVSEGTTAVDESMLTGESLPLERGPGEVVHAGTLNGTGAVTVRATGVGADSAVGRIARAVHEAQGSRAPIQRLADRVSAVFVPVVLAIAVVALLAFGFGTGDWSQAVSRAVAVLVVACPCALGLATPTAIVVATGRGAREGILVRDAAAFERLARVDTIALDKTGTLTRGEPVLQRTSLVAGSTLDEDELLRLAAAVEWKSEQPLARAFVEAALARGVERALATEVEARPGRGICGWVEGQLVWLGSPRAASEEGADADALALLLTPLEAEGLTVVAVTIDGMLAGGFGLADALRPGAKSTVESLRDAGLRPLVLSGDRAAAVLRASRELGIDDAHAELLPEDKLRILHELASTGARVAMVGDGINDGPALAAADVGIAMGGGADVAIEAADCALLHSSPERLPVLIDLARRTVATIRTNLALAFAYNALALPLAAGVLVPWTGFAIPPTVAAAAMAASSLIVVTNSLRLRSG